MRLPNSHYASNSLLPRESLDERIAPVVAYLLAPVRDDLERTFISLCSRDHSALIGISETRPARAFIGVDRDPASDPHELWGLTANDGVPSGAIPLSGEPKGTTPSTCEVGARTGGALIADVFSEEDVFERIEEAAVGRRLVFCRPPSTIPRTKFRDSIQDASRVAQSALGSRCVDFYAVEWYYAAACVRAMGKEGRAVIQVSSRLLNLGKCERDRREFIEAGLIEQVVRLPEALSHGKGEMTDALIVLSHGNDERIDVIDARDIDDDRAVKTLLRRLRERDYSKRDGVLSSWLTTIDIDSMWRDSWSLAPFAREAGEDETQVVMVSERFSVIRGVPRTAITGLPDPSVPFGNKGMPQWDCFYLMAASFEDGVRVSASDIPAIVESENVYNLADLVYAEGDDGRRTLDKLKLVDPYLPHVLIARSGSPFKVFMLDAVEQADDSQCGDENFDWMSRGIAIPDSMLCLTPMPPWDLGAGEAPCLPEYLLAYLSSGEGQALLRATAHGATVPQLSIGDVKRMRIPVPSLEAQREAARRFAARQRRYERALQDLSQALEDKRASVL